jgi:hypothetical protein
MGVFDDLQAGLDGLSGIDVNGGQAYCVDIVMCIDATGSMAPIIEEVKRNALAFCDKFHEQMDANGKNVETLRIKVIAFRDYGCDGAGAMAQSEFFVLPEQNEAFRSYVMGITATGGGDEPESALEAMALAMRSDWTSEGTKRRHVILVFTDASAVPLGDRSRTSNPAYPAGMPRSLAELGDMWAGSSQSLGGMPDEKSARLVLFAPSRTPWVDLQVWNNVWAAFSQAGRGLEEFDINMAIELLVNSING